MQKFSPSKIPLIHRPSKVEEGLGTRLGDKLSIHGANITAHPTRTELASLAQSLYVLTITVVSWISAHGLSITTPDFQRTAWLTMCKN